MSDLNYRDQFPALCQKDAGIYLDSAATSQKPHTVIQAIAEVYQVLHANVHRGNHGLTAHATNEYEAARAHIQRFIQAKSEKSIIWTRGSTEAINLVAQSYGRQYLQAGDEILVGEMEHHANIVPWQMIAQQTGAKIIKVPMTHDGMWDMSAFDNLISNRCKIVACAHITNVTGYRQPIESIIKKAHQLGAICLVDGAQGIVHEAVNVEALDCDFYVFSGHKLYGPSGIGVLYGKTEILEQMPPYHGGGKMVEHVSFHHTTYAKLPSKFEAGTPNISGAVGLSAAIDWFENIGYQAQSKHIDSLYQVLRENLVQIHAVKMIFPQPHASVLSFICFDEDGEIIHPNDIASLLDQQGIAVRAGHHCAHPFMDALQIEGTVRISLALYNTQKDIERFIQALKKAIEILY